MKPSHVMGGNLPHSKSAGLTVNFIWKILSQTSRVKLDQISGYQI